MLYHCFASFKQSLLDFFKLVGSRLILMLLCDSLNLKPTNVGVAAVATLIYGNIRLPTIS